MRPIPCLVDDAAAVDLVGVVKAALKHATAVALARDGEALCDDALEDEGGAVPRKRGEAALDDVVAIHVLDQLDHARVDRGGDAVCLLARVVALDHLLHHPCAVHVEGNLHDLRESKK